jgi:putative (di)nucleoside polyphosphate hydrolase
MMIVNREGRVWMGLRSHSEGMVYRMQMPQGGIDKGETPIQAVYREMREETGLHFHDVKLLAVAKKWYKYDLPTSVRRRRSIRGQRQKWFLFLLTSEEDAFNLTTDVYQEFIDYQWMDLDKVTDDVIPFKQEVYRHVVDEFRPYIESLR